METEASCLRLAAAHRVLLDRLSSRLRAYYKGKLTRIGKAAAEAEDLVQEQVLAIHIKRGTYDPDEPLTPWIYAIAPYKLIDAVLVRIDPRDVAAILGLSHATYAKIVQNLIWVTAYNAVAIPMAAGITFGTGFTMTPAVGAGLMSASTVIVAINAQLLRFHRKKG